MCNFSDRLLTIHPRGLLDLSYHVGMWELINILLGTGVLVLLYLTNFLRSKNLIASAAVASLSSIARLLCSSSGSIPFHGILYSIARRKKAVCSGLNDESPYVYDAIAHWGQKWPRHWV